MSTIGILGGGQLARMLAIAGAPLGQRFLVVDSAADACAGQVAPLLRADWRDFDALAEFARRVDVATFDFENVPAETAQWLTEHTRVFPNPRALAIAQDRLAEKNLFREIGLDTPAFAAVDSREDLARAIATIGLPAVLKTRRLGYDGKGQAVLRTPADADAAWSALGGAPLILEAFVAFRREVSVIAVRSQSGEFRPYPLTQNWHAGGILAASLAPAPDSADLERARVRACARAGRAARLRRHVRARALRSRRRSARQRDRAARAQLRALDDRRRDLQPVRKPRARGRSDLPLGDTAARGPSVMLNWIGELPDAAAILSESDAHWHDYGKEPRAGRKVGHATVCARTAAELSERLARIGRALGRQEQIAPVIAALAL